MIKPEKNCKYYRKCSNNFAADCTQKITMIIFFDRKRVIYKYAVPPKTFVNGEYYVSIFKSFAPTFIEKAP